MELALSQQRPAMNIVSRNVTQMLTLLAGLEARLSDKDIATPLVRANK